MSTQFKNRIVGVTILVMCVIIFLPSLIDGEKEVYIDEFVAVPIRPELKEHSLTLPEQIEVQEVAESENTLSEDNVVDDGEWNVEKISEPVTVQNIATKNETKQVKKKIEKKAKQPTEITKQFPDTAWTIQLGAFKDKKNINNLLKRLKRSGFQAHTIPKAVINGELTRIFVGPDVSRKKLEKQIPKLKKLTKLNGRIVAFDPVTP